MSDSHAVFTAAIIGQAQGPNFAAGTAPLAVCNRQLAMGPH